MSLKSASSRSQIFYAKTKRRSWNSRTSSRWAKHSIQSPWRFPMMSRLIKLCMPVFFSKDILECRFQVRFMQEKAKHFSVQLNAESAEWESFKASTGWSHGHLKHLKLFYMSIQNNTQTYQLYINASKSQFTFIVFYLFILYVYIIVSLIFLFRLSGLLITQVSMSQDNQGSTVQSIDFVLKTKAKWLSSCY